MSGDWVKPFENSGKRKLVTVSGPSGVGKTDTVYSAVDQDPYLILGLKFKQRKDGIPRSEDGKRDDCQIPDKDIGLLLKEGTIIDIYETGDTFHGIGARDIGLTGVSPIYMVDSYDGWVHLRNLFENRETVNALFYTNPGVLGKRFNERVENGFFSEEQAAKRSRTLPQNFAAFKEYANLFDLPICINPKELCIDPTDGNLSPECLEAKVNADAERFSKLIGLYHHLREHKDFKKFRTRQREFGRNRDPVGTSTIHHVYINQLAEELFQDKLGNRYDLLAIKSAPHQNGDREIYLDLSIEAGEAIKAGKYIPLEFMEYLSKIPVLATFKAHGRYSVILKPFHVAKDADYLSAEDIVLELIDRKLEKKYKSIYPGPSITAVVSGQNRVNESQFGLMNIEGGVYRDGALFAAGDPLLSSTHASLNIGFAYRFQDTKLHFSPLDNEILDSGRVGFPGNLKASLPGTKLKRGPRMPNGF